MHQDLALFATITMAILTAFVGGYIARKLGFPPLVGYLVAGMAIGPFTPGYVGDIHYISQLAEMGVIFMMFGVGLHFSLKDLWNVRAIAIPGALLQTLLATLVGFGLSQLWGWPVSAGLVLGLAISIASTVVLLRGLADNGLLNTIHGKVAVGWLVLEDLATVAILVLMPSLVSGSGNPLEGVLIAVLKTGAFVAIMLFLGRRFMPWLLTQIAHTRSRELFILAVVALSLGTAFLAAELFGVSLALAAFLAGVVLGESEIHHQVGAEITPFRDIFSVLFFVSVGMLVNPGALLANAGMVLIVTLLIIFGKLLITLMLGLFLPSSGRTIVVVSVSLSQIGEFSFIVGQTGVALGLMTQDQYGLILAGALLSIVANPLMFRAIPTIETLLKRTGLWARLDHGGAAPEPMTDHPVGHVVIVGYGRVGKHIGRVLQSLDLPFLVVEQDLELAAEIQQAGVKTMFGDAANSEIITHTGLEEARALIVTIPNETTTELIVAAAHDIAPNLPVIARAETETGVKRLVAHGAQQVIYPELEGGMELVRHMLLTLDYPVGQIQQYIDAARRDAYEGTLTGYEKYAALDELLNAMRGVEIAWHSIEEGSPLIGKSVSQSNIRSNAGASIIALVRDKEVIPNPKPDTTFNQGDRLALIGNTQELTAAKTLLEP